MTADADITHRRTVERDFDSRVDEWKTIYDGRSFHDDAIRVRLEKTIDIIDSLSLAPTSAALDIGCGAGQLVQAMKDRKLEAYGTDIAFGMADVAAEIGSPLTQGSADALPYRDDRFRLVTALGLIEYVPEPVEALREMARVLEPGATLVVTAPNPVRLGYLIDPVGVVMTLLRPPKGGYRRRYWHPKALRRDIEAAGLRVERIIGHGIGPIHLARRPVISEERSIRLGRWLERVLGARAARWMGANLIAIATVPG